VYVCTGLETEHATLAVRGQQGFFHLRTFVCIEQDRALFVVGGDQRCVHLTPGRGEPVGDEVTAVHAGQFDGFPAVGARCCIAADQPPLPDRIAVAAAGKQQKRRQQHGRQSHQAATGAGDRAV